MHDHIENLKNQYKDKKINLDELQDRKEQNNTESDTSFTMDENNQEFIIDGNKYTFDEMYNIYLENENFRGKVAVIGNIKKYIELTNIAKELKKTCNDVKNVKLNKPEKESQWASIHIDFLWMISFEKEQMKLLSKMIEIADDFSINGSSFSTVRLSFGINHVWQK